MIFLKLQLLCVVLWHTCLQVEPFVGLIDGGGGGDGDKREITDYRSIGKQLDDRIRALFGHFQNRGVGSSTTRAGSRSTRAGSRSISAGSRSTRTASSNTRAAPASTRAASSGSTRVDGFLLRKFGRFRKVTLLRRPKDEEDGGETIPAEGAEETTTAEGVQETTAAEEGIVTTVEEETTTAEVTTTTTTTTTTEGTTRGTPPKGTRAAARVRFAAESECEAANGGRPCVCSIPDFLARLRRPDFETVADETSAVYECPSYVVTAKAFVVSSATAAAETSATESLAAETMSGDGDAAAVDAEIARKPIDFDRVVHYSLDWPKDDHYTVHYGLVSSDLKLRCLHHPPPDDDGTNATDFKWDYAAAQHKTNSTVTGSNTNTLMILGIEPRDSKNYTCIMTETNATAKTVESYKHYAIVVERPVYEIHGTAVYQTSSDGCKNKTIDPVRKQLPDLVLNDLCPDGLSGYACNVVVETIKCSEDENSLEIVYSITQSDDLNHIIRATKIGHNALRYQKMMAAVAGILAANLNKLLSVPIVSKYTLFNTHFKPNHDRAKIESFVGCLPGFGIREIFCGACPPHHYSPNNSAVCTKCAAGFHQPIAASDSCVKCPNMFADGCSILPPMKNVPAFFYYVMTVMLLMGLIVFVVSCAFCCREEENKDRIKIIPRSIRNTFKRSKGYSVLDGSDNEAADPVKLTNASNVVKKKDSIVVDGEKPKQATVNSKSPLLTNTNENKSRRNRNSVKISEPSTSTYKKLAED